MKNRDQHYIPQYYLKGFANGTQINILDKKRVKAYTNSTKNIGFGKYYHNIDFKLLEHSFLFSDDELEIEQGNPQFVDLMINKYHEKLMGKFVKSFESLEPSLSLPDIEHLAIIDTDSLIDIVIFQFFRTDNFRDVIKRWFTNDKYGSFDKEIAVIQKTNYDSFISAYHNTFLLGITTKLNYKSKGLTCKKEFLTDFSPLMELFEKLKLSFKNSSKLLFLNATDTVFITSDTPLTALWTKEYDDFKHVYFPINKNCAFIFENNILDDKICEKGERSVEKISNANTVKKFNTSVLNHCDRFVYSSEIIDDSIFFNTQIPFEK